MLLSSLSAFTILQEFFIITFRMFGEAGGDQGMGTKALSCVLV